MSNETPKKKAKGFDKNMSFVEHLEALRWHIIRSVIAVGLITIGCFAYHPFLFKYVFLWPLDGTFPFTQYMCGFDKDFCFDKLPYTLQSLSPSETFTRALMISIISGFVLSFPYIVWELWRFLRPGLYAAELQATRGFVWIVTFLFMSGVSFAYFIITPVAFNFLANFSIGVEVENAWRISEVVSMVAQFALAGGLLFQLPVITYWLARIGIITPQFMRKYRKHAVVFALVLSGVLTPSPDVFSQLLLGLPLILLYEISILVCARVYKRLPQENFDATV